MSLGQMLFSFSGRLGRKEFSIYCLFFLITSFILYFLLSEKTADALLFFIFAWPSLAMQVKRLHDLNKSGWYVLLNVVPIVNLIMFVILLVRKGALESNKFGEPILS